MPTISPIWQMEREANGYRRSHDQRRDLRFSGLRTTQGFCQTDGEWDQETEQFPISRQFFIATIGFFNEQWVIPIWVEEGVDNEALLTVCRQSRNGELLVMPADIDLSDYATVRYTIETDGDGVWGQNVKVWAPDYDDDD